MEIGITDRWVSCVAHVSRIVRSRICCRHVKFVFIGSTAGQHATLMGDQLHAAGYRQQRTFCKDATHLGAFLMVDVRPSVRPDVNTLSDRRPLIKFVKKLCH